MKKNKRAIGKKPILALWRIPLLVGVLLVVGFMLLASMFGGRFGTPHQLTLDFLGPLQGVVSYTVSGFSSLKKNYLALLNVHEENQRLHALIDRYRVELGDYKEGYSIYLHLEELLNFKKKLSFEPIAARVVGKEPGHWYQTILIDRGRQDDVLDGMIVLSAAGVVGQVIHTSENYAKVLLANAPSSAIDAMIQRTRVRGILKGAGEKGFIFNYVLKKAEVEVGDDIVTAGIGGIFPAGIPLGKVSNIHQKQRGMFQEIEVEPSVDFQKLEFVFVDPTDRRKILESMNLSPER